MSTRIIIKNLPHNITPSRLKAHFSSSQSGNAYFSATVTDAKLVTDAKSGKSRGFAFVGYRTHEDAQKAVEWFNGTFVDMRKISVELAKPAGDESLGQSWREKNREYLARQKMKNASEEKPDDARKRKRDVVEDEEKKAAIHELTGPKRKNKLLYQNPDLERAQNGLVPTTQAAQVEKPKEKSKKRKAPTPDADESKKRVHVVESSHVVEVVYDDSVPQNNEPEETRQTEQPPANDLDWLRSRTSRTLGLISDDEGSDDGHDDGKAVSEDAESNVSDDDAPEPATADVTPVTPPATDPSDTEQTATAVKTKQSADEAKILRTGRLFIRNLVYGVTEDNLREIFSPYGEIEEIHIPIGDNQEPLPIAFVLFSVPRDALRAYQNLDGADLQGRLMHIIPGEERRLGKDDDPEGKTLKERREIEKRKQAGRGGDWGTLFMNQDAVLSSLAARHGVSKSDLLLDQNSSNTTDPAVKAAMAETTILVETRAYLTEHGVNLASLTTSQKSRSDTVIIAKNFPYGTTRDEIILLFGKSDTVKRVLLPPAGTIAFIEFHDAGQARAAFKRLAYRRFKDVPLYLEKAPQGIFETGPSTRLSGGIEAKKGSKDVLVVDEAEEEPGSTLYVKNLDFSTTQVGLTNAFKHFPGFRLATLKTKSSGKGGEKLSMGFGFVTFQSKELASAALNSGVVLDGRKLEIKFARQGVNEVKSSSATSVKGPARKKLVVKNLGFNVSKRDLRELFGTYGHIQSLRLPKKFDNSLRGFAFIEFTTASDARNAMESLKHTHLLGRHLVLEWAEEEEVMSGIEKMRGRVREGVQAGEVGKMMGLNAGGRVGDILDEDEE